MSIPEKCAVLVVGGGPAGSYTASVLAREGFDVVVLEAEKFPRYHIGESTLPSLRHYLRFIDLDSEFEQYGFTKKVGAAFKMSPKRREGFTSFALAGPDNYAWNLVRSEADELIFRHAGKSGAKIFDGVRVDSVAFADDGANGADAADQPGRPVSATWTRKSDGYGGSSGVIKFDYIVDACGRAGLLNTKYLKNRHYNQGLKNIAHWAYFEGAGIYGKDTDRNNAPFFEALHDESGWAWFIPLHNGTHSVGIVMNQAIATKKKKELGSTQEYFNKSLELAPSVRELLGDAKQTTDIKVASDYSYHSSSYAFPYARIIGDSGCFIDPFFSSGIHLATTSALSAGATIAASIREDCTEAEAADWHSSKVREGYARFLLIVLVAYKQMQNQDEYILSDFNEDNFDRAFSFFAPVIQGTVDATNKVTKAEFSKTLDFFGKAFSAAFSGPVDDSGEALPIDGPPAGLPNGGPPGGFPPNGLPPGVAPPNLAAGGHPPSGMPGGMPGGFPPSGMPGGFPPSGGPPGAFPPSGGPGGFPQPPPHIQALLYGKDISPEEAQILGALRIDSVTSITNLNRFTTDVINGLVPRLERGKLTLVKAQPLGAMEGPPPVVMAAGPGSGAVPTATEKLGEPAAPATGDTATENGSSVGPAPTSKEAALETSATV